MKQVFKTQNLHIPAPHSLLQKYTRRQTQTTHSEHLKSNTEHTISEYLNQQKPRNLSMKA